MIYLILIGLNILLISFYIRTLKRSHEKSEIELPALVEDIPFSEPFKDPTYFCGCPCKVCHENGWDCLKDSW